MAGTLADAPELRELEGGPAVCFLRLQCTWNQAPRILGDEDQLDRYPNDSMTRVFPRSAPPIADEGDALSETPPMVGFSEDVWF